VLDIGRTKNSCFKDDVIVRTNSRSKGALQSC
jgi:hypothetical protein